MSKRYKKFLVTFTWLGKALLSLTTLPFLFIAPYSFVTGEYAYGVLFTLMEVAAVAVFYNEIAATLEVDNGRITVCKGRYRKKIAFDVRDIKYVRKPKVGMFEIVLLDGRLITFPIMKALGKLTQYLEKQPGVMVLIE